MTDEFTFIYALIDPTDNKHRYVGKSDSPQKRLLSHIASRDSDFTPKGKWITSLLDKGLKPTLVILEEVPVTEWEEAERSWIAQFRSRGCDLLNVQEGGIVYHPVKKIKRQRNKPHIPITTATKPPDPPQSTGKPISQNEILGTDKSTFWWTTSVCGLLWFVGDGYLEVFGMVGIACIIISIIGDRILRWF